MRRLNGGWVFAAIRPGGKPEGLWALPKGHKGQIGAGETGEATALREVEEETGVRGRSLGKLGDVGPEFAHEVADVRWLPLADGPRLLAYDGEREMAEKALAALAGQDV